MKTLAILPAALLMALTCIRCVADSPVVVSKTLKPGAIYTQEYTDQLLINVLDVDITQPSMSVETMIANDCLTGQASSAGQAGNCREAVARAAIRKNALAAVNGDYFGPNGDPVGFGVTGSELYSEPWSTPRAAIGINLATHSTVIDILAFSGQIKLPSGQIFSYDAIDRQQSPRRSSDTVVYTQLYGSTSGARPGSTELILSGVNFPFSPNKLMTGRVQVVKQNITEPSLISDECTIICATANTPIATAFASLNTGDTVQFIAAVAPADKLTAVASSDWSSQSDPSASVSSIQNDAWQNVTYAIGGGPMLLKDGTISIDAAAEGFDDGFANGRHARTAIGVSDQGRIILMTIEGRPHASAGVSLQELAATMRRYGAVNAINLDGGGSTTMVVNGLTVNYPNQGLGERAVADMLVVRADNSAPLDTAVNSTDTSVGAMLDIVNSCTIGDSCVVRAKLGDNTLNIFSPDLMWAGPVTGGVGYVTQDGMFRAIRTGRGEVSALYRGHRISAPIMVKGREVQDNAITLATEFSDIKKRRSSSKLTVHAVTASGLPAANVTIKISVSGASVSEDQLQTDEDGLASTIVHWTSDNGAVTLSTAHAQPVSLARPEP